MSAGFEEADIARQDEEIEALSAIYGDDFLVVNEAEKLFDIRICHDKNTWWSMTLQLLLPRNYPSAVPPVFEVHAAWLDDSDEFKIRDKLYSIYRENKDELVVFQWVEATREFMNEKASECESSATSEGSEAHVSDSTTENTFQDSNCVLREFPSTVDPHLTETDMSEESFTYSTTEVDLPEILHGEPITDRKSTFQAHLAKVASEEQMEAVLRSLKSVRKIANATHNIVAYRIRKNSGVVIQDFDDDGEQHAGSRLLHLLQILNVQNYVIVVSRWFGGILLGPDRFKHINNCARNLLKTARVIQENSTKHGQLKKESTCKYKRKIKK